MKIPVSYKQMTVDQWMHTEPIVKNEALSRDEQNIKLLEYFTGGSIDDMPIDEYGKNCASISFLYSPIPALPVKNYRRPMGLFKFVPTTSVSDMSVAQMLDYYNVLKQHDNKVYECANKLLAIVYSRKGNGYDTSSFEDRANMFLSAKLEDVIGAVFFYSDCWQNVEPITEAYSVTVRLNMMSRIHQILQDKEFLSSLNIGDGSIV